MGRVGCSYVAESEGEGEEVDVEQHEVAQVYLGKEVDAGSRADATHHTSRRKG